MSHVTSISEGLTDHDLITRHDEKIKNLEQTAADTSEQLKWGIRLLIGTLITTVGTLVLLLAKKV